MVTTEAIRIAQTGGPEQLRYDEIEVGEPGRGQVLVRHEAIGVNFIDTYHREGLYDLGGLPAGIGMEAAGVVESIGEGVEVVQPGDRVGYATGPPGSYAGRRVMPAGGLVVLPDGVDAKTAAAVMLQGMTVEYLVRRCVELQPGQTVLWHAAAGGVGLLACQWLEDLDVTMIGTVSTEEKAERARDHGCDHPVIYTREDFTERVDELTDGRGVDVAYDSVGKETLEGSLDALRRRGTCVAFGNASGRPDPVDPLGLSRRGSLYLTRPSLMDYVATREELEESASAVFDALERGAIEARIDQTWPLAEAAEAHRALEGRETTGSIVLES